MNIPPEENKVVSIGRLNEPAETAVVGPEPASDEDRKVSIISRQLAPAIDRAAEHVDDIIKKLKTPYVTGMMHGITIVLGLRYLFKKDD